VPNGIDGNHRGRQVQDQTLRVVGVDEQAEDVRGTRSNTSVSGRDTHDTDRYILFAISDTI